MKKNLKYFGAVAIVGIGLGLCKIQAELQISVAKKNITDQPSRSTLKNKREIASIGKNENPVSVSSDFYGKVAKIALFLSNEILNQLKTTGQLDRQKILKVGLENPVEFTSAVKVLLEELPDSVVEVRSLILSLLVDLVSEVRQSQSDKQEKIFSMVYEIADREMESEELVTSPQLNKLSEYQKEILVHDGFLVQAEEQTYFSTLGPKIIALQLAKMDYDQNRANDYLKQVQAYKLRNISSFSLDTLKLAVDF